MKHQRIGGYARAAKYDGKLITQKARDAWNRRFEDEVDPDRQLLESERLRRALLARRAHMLRLSLASAKARAKRKTSATEPGGEAA